MWHLWAALGSYCHPNVIEVDPSTCCGSSCRRTCSAAGSGVWECSLQLSSPSAMASAADSFLVQLPCPRLCKHLDFSLSPLLLLPSIPQKLPPRALPSKHSAYKSPFQSLLLGGTQLGQRFSEKQAVSLYETICGMNEYVLPNAQKMLWNHTDDTVNHSYLQGLGLGLLESKEVLFHTLYHKCELLFLIKNNL